MAIHKFSDHVRSQNLSSGDYVDIGEFLNFLRIVSALQKIYKTSSTLTPLLNSGALHGWGDDARNTKNIYQANLHQKRPKGRSKARWKDDVENDVRKTGSAGWGWMEDSNWGGA